MIYHEEVFAVFVEADILQEGGGGEEGSYPRLCQGLLFRVVALIDICLDIQSTVKIII